MDLDITSQSYLPEISADTEDSLGLLDMSGEEHFLFYTQDPDHIPMSKEEGKEIAVNLIGKGR